MGPLFPGGDFRRLMRLESIKMVLSADVVSLGKSDLVIFVTHKEATDHNCNAVVQNLKHISPTTLNRSHFVISYPRPEEPMSQFIDATAPIRLASVKPTWSDNLANRVPVVSNLSASI